MLILVRALPTHPTSTRNRARRIIGAPNLRQIRFALRPYQADYNDFPESLAMLNQQAYLADGKVYGCCSLPERSQTAATSSQRYLAGKLKVAGAAAAQQIVICEHARTGSSPCSQAQAWRHLKARPSAPKPQREHSTTQNFHSSAGLSGAKESAGLRCGPEGSNTVSVHKEIWMHGTATGNCGQDSATTLASQRRSCRSIRARAHPDAHDRQRSATRHGYGVRNAVDHDHRPANTRPPKPP